MLDLRVPALPTESGERLTHEAYKRVFWAVDAKIRNGHSWKLERRQHFLEHGNASRDALARGDWQEALRLLEAGRDKVRAVGQDDERRGNVFHRLRVVEEPLSPYLQWELHTLRLRAEYGEQIRVLPASVIAAAETDGLLPEVTLLDGHTLFQVLYGADGASYAAIRYADSEVVSGWLAYITQVYAAGEDLASYFDRVVATLPPPTIAPE
jgi:hypothetical protein